MLHVAAVQFDIVWEDKHANHEIIESMLADARVPRGALVLLPELGDTGFSFNLDRIVDKATLPFGKRLAERFGVWIQVGHAERGPDGRGRNCATLISPDGVVCGCYQKVHPFSFGREAEFFSGGEHLFVHRIDQDHGEHATIAPLICYDLRFPELWRLAALNGAEVFAIGASWPAARQAHWRALNIARAIENQAFVVAVNRVGADPHLPYAGGSMIVGPKGELLAEADDQPQVLQAELDLAVLRSWRETFPALRDVHRSLLGTVSVQGSGLNIR